MKRGTVKFNENEGTIILVKPNGFGFIELKPLNSEEGLESFYFGDSAGAYYAVSCQNGLRLISKPTEFASDCYQNREFAVYDTALNIKLLEIEVLYE